MTHNVETQREEDGSRFGLIWRTNLAEKKHSASNCENGFAGIVVVAAGESVPDAGNRRKEES